MWRGSRLLSYPDTQGLRYLSLGKYQVQMSSALSLFVEELMDRKLAQTRRAVLSSEQISSLKSVWHSWDVRWTRPDNGSDLGSVWGTFEQLHSPVDAPLWEIHVTRSDELVFCLWLGVATGSGHFARSSASGSQTATGELNPHRPSQRGDSREVMTECVMWLMSLGWQLVVHSYVWTPSAHRRDWCAAGGRELERTF